jgi:lariat debranching enzyme
MALDKPLPGREFLEAVDILPTLAPTQQRSTDLRLQYDPEWLAITRALHTSLKIGKRGEPTPPDLGEAVYRPMVDKERRWVEENIVRKDRLEIPENFSVTAPPHMPGDPESADRQPDEYTNPQTREFCRLLDVENLWDATDEERAVRKAGRPPLDESSEIRGTDSRADRSSKRGGRDGRSGGRAGKASGLGDRSPAP